ncbi:MAG TPA: DUF4491 family protein [Pseudobacteroides sp.]
MNFPSHCNKIRILLRSIQEIIKQEERVLKGWFPHNPKKKEK